MFLVMLGICRLGRDLLDRWIGDVLKVGGEGEIETEAEIDMMRFDEDYVVVTSLLMGSSTNCEEFDLE